MKKVMIFGTFDILHKGHLNFFEQAKKYGDYLILVVARDKTVKKIKGRLPMNNEKKRLETVRKYADKTVLGCIKDRYNVIRKFKPDLICLGYDQEASLKDLKKFEISIKRLRAYEPHKYKSSKLS
ncbi:FAD synthase [Candidatus Woesearchaeota archaeon B3_Woes]|nr:MAG: FAD synthase [Candidatus Woesearchaeota archaeon B3_Woes]